MSLDTCHTIDEQVEYLRSNYPELATCAYAGRDCEAWLRALLDPKSNRDAEQTLDVPEIGMVVGGVSGGDRHHYLAVKTLNARTVQLERLPLTDWQVSIDQRRRAWREAARAAKEVVACR